MDLERFRSYAAALPHVAETVQWGDNLVLWCGARELGGKMFAIADLEPGPSHVAGFAAGPERYAELLEREGFKPAPHLARAHWVAAERWEAMSASEWRAALTAAHAYVLGRMPKRTQALLSMPKRERNRVLRERDAILNSRKK